MTKKPTDADLVRFETLDDVPVEGAGAKKPMSDSIVRLAIASDPDAVDTSEPGFWDTAEVKLPIGKGQITLRIDRDILDWFRDSGRGYQTRINAVLRSYMEARKTDR